MYMNKLHAHHTNITFLVLFTTRCRFHTILKHFGIKHIQMNIEWTRIVKLHTLITNHLTSSQRADTLICHTTMHRNPINFLYNPCHVTLWCVKVGTVANAREGSTQEHNCARVVKLLPNIILYWYGTLVFTI